jgi:DNA polymerase I
MAKQKQLSIYDLLDDASDSRPGLPPGETAASPTLHADAEAQGSLFDASFQLDVDFTEVPLPEGYRVADDEAAVAALAKELRAAGRFAFDTETDSLDPLRATLIGISLSTAPGTAVYVPTAHASGRGLSLEALRRLLGPVFADPSIGKIGHNLKYDLRAMTHAGLPTQGAAFDTMLASQLLDPDLEAGLKELARREFGASMTDYRALTSRGKRRLELRQLSISAVAAYAGADADYTFRLYQRFASRIPEDGLQRVFDLEMALLPIVAEMEDAGLRLDVAYLRGLEKTMTAQVARIAEEVYALAGVRFNLNSTPQLADVLYNRLGLPVLKETKTGRSTDESVLRALSSRHPLPAKLLEYRERQKLVSTYVTALAASVNPETGRVHPHFRQLGAVSGRFSCTEPNLQNLPKDGENTIRRAFVAEPGKKLLSADYSQIELRILAHITDDPTLRRTFQEGEDVHRRTAAEIFGVEPEAVTPEQRRVAKTVVFGIAYGQSPVGLANQLQMPVEQAQAYIEQYFTRYPGVRRYTRETVAQATKSGFVTTLLGRRRPMPQLKSREPRVRAAAERQAVNHPIQGAAADIVKMAMCRLAPRLAPFDARLLLQVHDELVLEVAADQVEAVREVVVRSMEEPPLERFSVPLVVETKVAEVWS